MVFSFRITLPLVSILSVAVAIGAVQAEEIRLSSADIESLKSAAHAFSAHSSQPPTLFKLPPSIDSKGIELIPHDIRAKDYQQFENMLPVNESDTKVTLFKGMNETEDNFLRISLVEQGDQTRVEGLLKKDGEFFGIAPHILDPSGNTLLLSQVTAAQIQQAVMSCGALAKPPELIDEQRARNSAQDFRAASSYLLQVATDADYEYVQALGSATAANAKILSILNGVDAIYRNQFNIAVLLTSQNAWSSFSDPYTSTDSDTRLVQMRNYWQANFNSSRTYDVAHLWTGVNLDGSTVGIAYIDGTCSSYRYGLSQKYDVPGAEVPLTAHEIGHNLSADHDSCPGSQSWIMCPVVIPNATIFSPASKSVILSALSSYDCISVGTAPSLSPSPSSSPSRSAAPSSSPSASRSAGASASTSPSRPPSFGPTPTPGIKYDLRGSGTASFVVYRAASGTWFDGTASALATGNYGSEQLGLHTDVPLLGDYDGDGKSDRGVYRDSNSSWYLKQSSTGNVSQVYLGGPGYIPVPGVDHDGDRIDDVTVYDPQSGIYSYRTSSGQRVNVPIGGPGYVPVSCDYNGDGKADPAVFSVASRTWLVSGLNGEISSSVWGEKGDIPVPGVYDGSGQCVKAIWRPTTGEWYIEGKASYQWGLPGDYPITADFDGDRINDSAVWRPGFGLLYIRYSTAATQVVQLGLYFDKLPQLEPLLYALRNAYPNIVKAKGAGSAHLLGYQPNAALLARIDASGSSFQSYSGARGRTLLEGDYNGDGSSDAASFKAGEWRITLAGGGEQTRYWGVSNDIPVSGDFDGDGITDIAVYRPGDSGIYSKWYVVHSSDGGAYETQFGLSGDIPFAMDVSGDGYDDLVVLRPTSMHWYVRDGRSGAYLGAYQWGLTSDIPCTGDYNGDGYDDICVYRPSQNTYYINFPKVGYSIYQWGLPGDVQVTPPGRTTKLGIYRPANGIMYERSVIDGSVALTSVGSAGEVFYFANNAGVAIP